ncbi:MAG: hypothetical protein H0U58_07615 [Chloroflexi bacterium]|nr:hypothetical protein [Chloroflexota bacterium]
MPIVTRPGELGDRATTALVALPAAPASTLGAELVPPEDLLPSGGTRVPAPAPALARLLALDAVRLLRPLRVDGRPRRRPTSWTDPTFVSQIEFVRAQLRPVPDRRALTASWGREACQHTPTPGAGDELEAVRLAYALCWLELGDGVVRPAWDELMAPPA